LAFRWEDIARIVDDPAEIPTRRQRFYDFAQPVVDALSGTRTVHRWPIFRRPDLQVKVSRFSPRFIEFDVRHGR
jgi:hypothetical protein